MATSTPESFVGSLWATSKPPTRPKPLLWPVYTPDGPAEIKRVFADDVRLDRKQLSMRLTHDRFLLASRDRDYKAHLIDDGVKKLMHSITKEMPACVDCAHTKLHVETITESATMNTVTQLTAKCDFRACGSRMTDTLDAGSPEAFARDYEQNWNSIEGKCCR